ncbi:MAG: phage holin family protein [Bacteroidales bacterium]|nr:phage holin family protein [Bacteroidales bacterium]
MKEDNTQIFGSLLQRAVEYGKTNIELMKLKLLDKILDVVSSLIPPVVVFVLVGSFLFFLSFGLALWLGDLLGAFYVGFILMAALYGIIAIIVHFFMYKNIKRIVSDYIIKQMFK